MEGIVACMWISSLNVVYPKAWNSPLTTGLPGKKTLQKKTWQHTAHQGHHSLAFAGPCHAKDLQWQTLGWNGLKSVEMVWNSWTCKKNMAPLGSRTRRSDRFWGYIPRPSFVAQFVGTWNFKYVSTNLRTILKFQDSCTENVRIHALNTCILYLCLSFFGIIYIYIFIYIYISYKSCTQISGAFEGPGIVLM